MRQTFEDRLLEIHQMKSARTSDDAEVWSLTAQAVGAVTLARAMRSRAARKSLLDGVARGLLQVLDRRGTRK